MPNLQPPVTSVAQAAAYRQRILDVLPVDTDFNPLMTLYLTDNTSPDDIRQAVDHALPDDVRGGRGAVTTYGGIEVTAPGDQLTRGENDGYAECFGSTAQWRGAVGDVIDEAAGKVGETVAVHIAVGDR